ncbi:MAG: hypothetical protein Q9223_007963, partial [Gallowayella weberi]
MAPIPIFADPFTPAPSSLIEKAPVAREPLEDITNSLNKRVKNHGFLKSSKKSNAGRFKKGLDNPRAKACSTVPVNHLVRAEQTTHERDARRKQEKKARWHRNNERRLQANEPPLTPPTPSPVSPVAPLPSPPRTSEKRSKSPPASPQSPSKRPRKL